MVLKTLLQPALYIMSKLSFKTKIITSILLLFILLLLPSKKLFTEYIEKNNRYNKQLIGLRYIEVINSFIKTVQVHRTLSLQYLEESKNNVKDSNCLQNLQENEIRFQNQKETLMGYDVKNFNFLGSNQSFAKAIASYDVITEDTFDRITSISSVFKTHGEIIKKLMNTITEIAKYSQFTSNKDRRINYIAIMLQEKLPYLNDFTKQLSDTSFNTINTDKKLKAQKLVLYSISTDLSSLRIFLENNYLISDLPNYHALEGQITAVTHRVNQLLIMIDNRIINSDKENLDNDFFLEKINSTIETEDMLYTMFSYAYKDAINELMSKSNNSLWSLLTLFLVIVLIALYIFIAFYYSITGNLKKLQTASEMIAEGNTNIKLKVDKSDEIGDALLAFNTMSEKLSENIAFLDGYKTAIDTSSIVSKTDTKGIITYVNKMFCEVSGYTKNELIGRSHNIIRHEDNSVDIFENMWETIQAKKIWKGILKNKNKDGTAYIVNATILPILDSDNNILEYIGVRHDITELEKSKEEIKKQRTDLLTSLPNRNQLLVDLKVAVKPILFYLNIDNFSGFNDFYGSDIGDSVIVKLADTLKKFKRLEAFQLYRLQGDQFILLFQEEQLSNKNFHTFFTELFTHIEQNISSINIKNQNRINISITGGVATYYTHDNYQNLILYANIARKKAQEQQKKFLIFDHTMRKSEDYAQNIEWIKKIKEAIDENRITTYYQGIVDNKTEKIVKYETLVRMLDNEGLTVSTLTLLEIAQKAKLYPQITKIVVAKALKTFKNMNDIQFSINLTIDDILSEDITQFIYKKLNNYPNSHNIIFEITESEEVSDYKIINDFIEEVQKYGSKIAIDDFGSGYANFEHIININADFIKIDGSLIKNITKDKNAAIITEAIISFSKKLGKKTITEYVHNKEVYETVKALGADYSQGYYFGEPSPNVI
ncbi:MAG: diguanylate cyclase/phosphodiesterase (GGDEF & EAL domains) with PAS/PAC sensor(s) [uncultured Sulfurovum sp.]|uniref:Diguanylate cyclase/phosphodiesterase (GGDEF & EAL domains) with PAS/PAC sensor(S) n=1 Tax=uncultured Sulfurovum sp. TaxID=269237 RepID=A0A6S6U6V9_9BACT|nr:MAG: diguanylate cyclase/phosphodiesterase (GGDEF & EAL domains) with PAS/PAC sensor(s) [uncultured Sulfurovum sp.]